MQNLTPGPLVACLVGALGLSACGSVQTRSIGAETWLLRCEPNLAACVARAPKLCRGEAFYVVRGHSYKVVSGVPGNQMADEDHELVIHCGPEPRFRAAAQAPAAAPQEATETPASPDATRAQELLGTRCVPGASQACVGPGGCTGGQSCVADGSGFAPCDCGPEASAQPPASPEAEASPEPPTAGGDAAPPTPTSHGPAAPTREVTPQPAPAGAAR